mmetsp:Transcript_32154/g.113046  ORF Transcript_32154/g.113046 Transcript_32154/m.113046 type:complete len:665 (+) Transcript_32154:420-2414(+)
MLRRIQPHQHRGPFGHRPADRVDPVGHQRPRGFHALRGVVHPDQARLRRLYYHEPGLRRPQRAPGFPVRALPARRHDGPRLRPHRRDHVLRLWVRGRQGARLEDGHDVQALLGAVLVAAALRLRHARGQDGHHGGGQLEAGRTDGGRVHLAPPGAARRERAQILGRRLAPLPGHHLRFVPRSFEAGARLRGAVCGSEAGDAKGKLAAARVVCFQDHSALRDDRRPPRPHARRADGRRQDEDLLALKERADQDHRHDAQGRAVQPKGDPGAGDVRRDGLDERRMDDGRLRRHVGQVQQPRQRVPHVDHRRRARRRHLDRRPEHRAGRQPHLDAGQRGPHAHDGQREDHVRGGDARQRLAGHRLPGGHHLHRRRRTGLGGRLRRLDPDEAGGAAGAAPWIKEQVDRLLHPNRPGPALQLLKPPGQVRRPRGPHCDDAVAAHALHRLLRLGRHQPRRLGRRPGEGLGLRAGLELRGAPRNGGPRQTGRLFTVRRRNGPPAYQRLREQGRRTVLRLGFLGGARLELPIGRFLGLRLSARADGGQYADHVLGQQRAQAAQGDAAGGFRRDGQDEHGAHVPERAAHADSNLQLLIRDQAHRRANGRRVGARQEGRQELRAAQFAKDDVFHRRHVHARGEQLGRPADVGADAAADRVQRVLLPGQGQAGRL